MELGEPIESPAGGEGSINEFWGGKWKGGQVTSATTNRADRWGGVEASPWFKQWGEKGASRAAPCGKPTKDEEKKRAAQMIQKRSPKKGRMQARVKGVKGGKGKKCRVIRTKRIDKNRTSRN